MHKRTTTVLVPRPTQKTLQTPELPTDEGDVTEIQRHVWHMGITPQGPWIPPLALGWSYSLASPDAMQALGYALTLMVDGPNEGSILPNAGSPIVLTAGQ